MMSERKKLKMVSSTTASVATPAAPSVAPDPEVHAVAKRRQFSAAYKLAVLEEADRCSSPGAIGALLRREALYSSHLTVWRREREAGALAALGARRGRKAKLTAEQRRIAELQSRCAQLERELSQAHTIVEVQKNSARCWGFRRRRQPRAPGANLERGERTRAGPDDAASAALARCCACLVSLARTAWATRRSPATRTTGGALGKRARDHPRRVEQPTLGRLHAVYSLGAAARRGDLSRLGTHLLSGAQ